MNFKKIFWWIFVLFLIFWLFTQPRSFANVIGNLWDLLMQLLDSMLKFFTSL